MESIEEMELLSILRNHWQYLLYTPTQRRGYTKSS